MKHKDLITALEAMRGLDDFPPPDYPAIIVREMRQYWGGLTPVTPSDPGIDWRQTAVILLFSQAAKTFLVTPQQHQAFMDAAEAAKNKWVELQRGHRGTGKKLYNKIGHSYE